MIIHVLPTSLIKQVQFRRARTVRNLTLRVGESVTESQAQAKHRWASFGSCVKKASFAFSPLSCVGSFFCAGNCSLGLYMIFVPVEVIYKFITAHVVRLLMIHKLKRGLILGSFGWAALVDRRRYSIYI